MPTKTRGQGGNLTDTEAAEDSRFSKLESKVNKQKRTIDELKAEKLMTWEKTQRFGRKFVSN